MHNILVTGSNGQLGSEIRVIASKYPNYNFLFTDSEQLDITKYNYVNEFIKKNQINIIINCAAYTAVDKAEDEPELANSINNLAVENLARISEKRNIKLIHISTDYVFDGNTDHPYKPNDSTNPKTIYGESKLAGENSILKFRLKDSIIIRTSWVYSKYGNNFVKTMLSLAEKNNQINVVKDQYGSPTYAGDLAYFILEVIPLIKNISTEIYHFSNKEKCSWYEFAKRIFELIEINVKINPISTKQYPTKAKRPKYSVLDTTKTVKKFSLRIFNWEESLEKYLKEISI